MRDYTRASAPLILVRSDYSLRPRLLDRAKAAKFAGARYEVGRIACQETAGTESGIPRTRWLLRPRSRHVLLTPERDLEASTRHQVAPLATRRLTAMRMRDLVD